MSEKWAGCYDDSWRDLIVPAAFAHPAKAARGLLVRIFDALFEMGAVQRGDMVVDPFAGVCTTGIEAASRGLRFVGCELEPRFVALARENFELHRRDWDAYGCWQPVIVQGDSRRLREHVGPLLAECVVGSPPYTEEVVHARPSKMTKDIFSGRTASTGLGAYGASPGQLGAMPAGSVEAILSSPPYINEDLTPRCRRYTGRADALPPECGRLATATGNPGEYGSSDGQLGQMREGSIEAIVSSPPYAEIASGAGGLNTKPAKAGQQGGRSPASASQDTDQRYGETGGQLARMALGDVDAVVSSPPFLDARSDTTASVKGHTPTAHDPEAMGTTNGNLSRMRGGDVDALVSSPPWEANCEGGVRARKWRDPEAFLKAGRGHGCSDDARLRQMARDNAKVYGDTAGQLGREQGDTFWLAARDIVRECHAILKPGGYAVWIVKAFVRNKQIVDFPGDWRRLCEACGFETVREVHAMLVSEEKRPHLFDGERVTVRARKSFFRRLAESKGSPAIDWETVWFMRKPR